MRTWFVLLAVALAVGCSAGEPGRTFAAPAETARTAPAFATASAGRGTRPRIVILGDSLTAGLGLDVAQSYPSLLQRHLDAAGYKYEVVNAGVSGDTSAGGLRRLEWSLDGNVRLLVVALGGNDGLRGLPVEELRSNLSKMIEGGQARGATVVLAGMEAPPNYGPAYTAAFRKTYQDLARQYRITLLPFLLDGVAGIRTLNNADGIHPNVAGARIVERSVFGSIAPLLDRLP